MNKLAAALMLGAALAATPAFADEKLNADVQKDYNSSLKDLFLYFHQNPELSFMEKKTSARLAQELRKIPGLEVTEHVGGTGVVAVAKNGAGPTVLIRADMDGLPIEEKSGLAYASKVHQVDVEGVDRPVMHACGHDTHITALVGEARQLMARKDQWRGTIVFIGQPAEERIGGAKKMLEDGLYTRFPKPDYAIAFHVNAQDEAGKIGVPETIAYSSSDSIDIKVRGVGAHGASPHKGLDPVLIASQIVVSLQSIVSRSIDPLEPAVITVGSIHGGTKHNIISDEVDMQLTVRADTPETRQKLLDGIKRVAEGTARALGADDDHLPIISQHGGESTPPTQNDPESARKVKAAIAAALGADKMSTKKREGMGAEDFAYFVEPKYGVKGVYIGVGGTPAAEVETAASHHSALFKISPEPVITSGVEAMTVAAMALLAKP